MKPIIDTVTLLRLAELTIEDIELHMSDKSDMSTGAGKLIAIENALARLKYYKEHPEHIPPYVMEKISDIETTESAQ